MRFPDVWKLASVVPVPTLHSACARACAPIKSKLITCCMLEERPQHVISVDLIGAHARAQALCRSGYACADSCESFN